MADILKGTNVDPISVDRSSGGDPINVLCGNGHSIGKIELDSIERRGGNDRLDLSNVGRGIYVCYCGRYVDTVGFFRWLLPGFHEHTRSSFVPNIQTFIGDSTQTNTINDFRRYPYQGTGDDDKVDIDLATGEVKYYGRAGDAVSQFTIENFDNISVPYSSGRLVGNARNNNITGGRTSVIVGSQGNDSLSGGTIDYTNLAHSVKFTTKFSTISETVDKGDFGKDIVFNYKLKKIVGATNKDNLLDTSSESSVDLNLESNLLKTTNPDGSITQVEVVNFVNAIGSRGNDTIVGSNISSKLIGGGGNDIMIGGNKNDCIIGTDSTNRGMGEIDTLSGGSGENTFILGDNHGAYYLGNGSDDYAKITDFDLFNDSIYIGSLKNYSFDLEGTNTIDLFSVENVKNRDLIAKIQIKNHVNCTNSKIMSISRSTGFSLDEIISQLDILCSNESSLDD